MNKIPSTITSHWSEAAVSSFQQQTTPEPLIGQTSRESAACAFSVSVRNRPLLHSSILRGLLDGAFTFQPGVIPRLNGQKYTLALLIILSRREI